jgi:membrane protein implicated in regulation of membrane protease activity
MRELLMPPWIEFLIWLAVSGGLAIFEATTPSFYLIWFAGGALIASIVALMGFNEIIQFSVFLVSSVIFLLFARPIVKKYIHLDKEAAPSNVYTLIGVKAIVLTTVTQMNGRIKIMNTGETWSAYTYDYYDPIEANNQVIIKEVDGAKLVVVPKDAASAEKITIQQ